MTPEAQNKAIAEACGRRYHKPTEAEMKSGSYYQYEPDFAHDLNLMHEAEKAVFKNDPSVDQSGYYNAKWYIYRDNLQIATGGTKTEWQEHRVICATASERAEAFLRAIGKWEE